MLSRIDESAVDRAFLAFTRAFTLMRKNPTILHSVYTLMLEVILVLCCMIGFCMFFVRSMDAVTLATCAMVVSGLIIGVCAVVEFFATIVLAAHVRVGRPRSVQSAREQVRHRLTEVMKLDPVRTTVLIIGSLLSVSSFFCVYILADIAVKSAGINNQLMTAMFVLDFLVVAISAAVSVFAVIGGRYLVVHGLTPELAFTRTREAMSMHKQSCMVAFGVSVLMGFMQALLAFIIVATHIQFSSDPVNALGIIVACCMFCVMWILQIVPYIALTERRAI